ncbi:hypothetical protein M422DRAFT_247900 [Sphaerobolus stellatus SS14]|nr:hypothetical protein M422DRAFT_247900 [Sphaerobolus stellatus SS14]
MDDSWLKRTRFPPNIGGTVTSLACPGSVYYHTSFWRLFPTFEGLVTDIPLNKPKHFIKSVLNVKKLFLTVKPVAFKTMTARQRRTHEGNPSRIPYPQKTLTSTTQATDLVLSLQYDMFNNDINQPPIDLQELNHHSHGGNAVVVVYYKMYQFSGDYVKSTWDGSTFIAEKATYIDREVAKKILGTPNDIQNEQAIIAEHI